MSNLVGIRAVFKEGFIVIKKSMKLKNQDENSKNTQIQPKVVQKQLKVALKQPDVAVNTCKMAMWQNNFVASTNIKTRC